MLFYFLLDPCRSGSATLIKQIIKVEPEPGQSDGSGSETLVHGVYCRAEEFKSVKFFVYPVGKAKQIGQKEDPG